MPIIEKRMVPLRSHLDRNSKLSTAASGGAAIHKGGRKSKRRSRNGFTTKIHAKLDASGDIIAFYLTGGEAFDGRHSPFYADRATADDTAIVEAIAAICENSNSMAGGAFAPNSVIAG
jgi:hypothetical protein